MTTDSTALSLQHSAFLEQMEPLTHKQRSRHMISLGRRAQEPEVAALLDRLEAGDAWQRRLAVMSCYTARDGARVLRGTQDASRHVRQLALGLAGLCCDGEQAFAALTMAWELNREDRVAQTLYREGKRAPIGAFIGWLAERSGVDATIDLLPMAEEPVLRAHLPAALARPSKRFWKRMAGCAPAVLAEILCGELRAVPGEPDTVTRQLIEQCQQTLAVSAPDATLTLAELLIGRRIHPQIPTVNSLIRLRPVATLDVLVRYGHRPAPGSFNSTLDRLPLESVCRLARWAPEALGAASDVAQSRPRQEWGAIARAWAEDLERSPAWGIELISGLSPLYNPDDPDAASLREALYQSWSLAARDKDGIIPGGSIERLPQDLAEREGRRHIQEVVALHTRPPSRIFYARYVPWEEAEQFVRDWLGYPDGTLRGIALYNLLYIAGRYPDRPELTDRALKLVLARKNEQDPVRASMAQALGTWPKALWRPDHLPSIARIVRDGLDAADLSHGTAQHLEALVLPRFGMDAEWAARWLHTLLKERGRLYDTRLGRHLTEKEVDAVGPMLLDIAKIWAARDRDGYLIPLLTSLGGLIFRIAGMVEVVLGVMDTTPHAWTSVKFLDIFRQHNREKYLEILPRWIKRWLTPRDCGVILNVAKEEKSPIPEPLLDAAESMVFFGYSDGLRAQALEFLYRRAPDRLNRTVEKLLAQDRSNVIIARIAWLLSRHRHDLLSSFLADQRMTGKAASGRTSWLMLWEGSYYRWTPDQNALYRRALTRVINDPDRDTPTILECQARLAALCYGEDTQLIQMVDDERPVVQERALRVLGRCDESRGLPTLLRCLGDARARIAIYGLRKALKELPGARSLEVLKQVPLQKVTVAKEVVRLLGELRAPAAYDHLLLMDTPTLHRDIRIALLRATWDHLHRESTWSLYRRAAAGPDWILAARVGDVPPDRLTVRTDRLLSEVMAQVVERPEPEARIDLLNRAAYLSIRDPDKVFLAACRRRIASVYDDEVRAAVMAQLHRSDERDIPAWKEFLCTLDDARAWTVLIDTLISQNPRARALYLGMALAAADALADPRWLPLRLRLQAAALEPEALPEALAGEVRRAGGDLPVDAMNMAMVTVKSLPAGKHRAAIDALIRQPEPALRRLAVAGLEQDAAPGRGWSARRRKLLARLRGDGDASVAGAAGLIFPPREQDVKPDSGEEADPGES